MTTLLDKAISRLRALSPDRQDEAAELVLTLIDEDPESVQLSEAQATEVHRRLGTSEPTVSYDDVVLAVFHAARTPPDVP